MAGQIESWISKCGFNAVYGSVPGVMVVHQAGGHRGSPVLWRWCNGHFLSIHEGQLGHFGKRDGQDMDSIPCEVINPLFGVNEQTLTARGVAWREDKLKAVKQLDVSNDLHAFEFRELGNEALIKVSPYPH